MHIPGHVLSPSTAWVGAALSTAALIWAGQKLRDEQKRLTLFLACCSLLLSLQSIHLPIIAGGKSVHLLGEGFWILPPVSAIVLGLSLRTLNPIKINNFLELS